MLENALNSSTVRGDGDGSSPSLSPNPGVPGKLDPATALIGVSELCFSSCRDIDSCICLKLTASTPFEAVGTICGSQTQRFADRGAMRCRTVIGGGGNTKTISMLFGTHGEENKGDPRTAELRLHNLASP